MKKALIIYSFAFTIVMAAMLHNVTAANAQAWACSAGQDCRVPAVTQGDTITMRCVVEALNNRGSNSFLTFRPRQCSLRITYETSPGRETSKVLSCLARPNQRECRVSTTLADLGFQVGDKFVEAKVEPHLTIHENNFGCVNDRNSPGYSFSAKAIGQTFRRGTIGGLMGPPYAYEYKVLHRYICAR